jgi:hypothetical protein
VLCLVDEEYCIISLVTHVYYAYKQSTNYLKKKQVDEEKLREKITALDLRFSELYRLINQFFIKCSNQKNASFSKKIPTLSLKAIDFILQTKIL